MRWSLLLVCAVVFGLLPATGRALTADELLLITNRNMPQGRALAEHYAKVRNVPPGRILEIPLPVTEEVDYEQYERFIQPAVRKHLEENNLKDQVKCLVTFYGVPLRLRDRKATAEEQQEVADLKRESGEILPKIDEVIAQLERELVLADPSFKAQTASGDAEALARRADHALKAVEKVMPTLPPDTRQRLMADTLKVLETLTGPAGLVQRLRPPPGTEEASKLQLARQQVEAAGQELARLQREPGTLANRARIRELVQRNFGLLTYSRILQQQMSNFGDATGSAVDSELAMLWHDGYPRARWVANPLHFARPDRPADEPPTLMVARLDAPRPSLVGQMIDVSSEIESTGLTGTVAIDAGGSLTLGTRGQGPDGYSRWDDHLRAFARIARTNPRNVVVLDEQAPVFARSPAGDPAVADVAVYCGWYSLRNYVPGLEFRPGAVGYHIASFELASLRGKEEKGWVKGLLENGVVATLGPVAEPLLDTFPRPDQFLPLVMTGRLTLAEAYWRVAPTASWMLTLVGDPLYRPFAKQPMLRVEDLPQDLRKAIE